MYSPEIRLVMIKYTRGCDNSAAIPDQGLTDLDHSEGVTDKKICEGDSECETIGRSENVCHSDAPNLKFTPKIKFHYGMNFGMLINHGRIQVFSEPLSKVLQPLCTLAALTN